MTKKLVCLTTQPFGFGLTVLLLKPFQQVAEILAQLNKMGDYLLRFHPEVLDACLSEVSSSSVCEIE